MDGERGSRESVLSVHLDAVLKIMILVQNSLKVTDYNEKIQEEGRRVEWLKHCEYNNKNEDNN